MIHLTRDQLDAFEGLFEDLWRFSDPSHICKAQTALLEWMIGNPGAVRAMATFAAAWLEDMRAEEQYDARKEFESTLP